MLRAAVGWVVALTLVALFVWRERESGRREFDAQWRALEQEVARFERELKELDAESQRETERRSQELRARHLKPALEVARAWRERVRDIRAKSGKGAEKGSGKQVAEKLKQAEAALECAEAGYQFDLPPACEGDCAKGP
jgi:hypothetical protein